jgi:hypothetical protein
MDFIVFPAMNDDGRNVVQLADVLSSIKTNDLVWSVQYLDSVGEPPEGIYLAELEEKAKADPEGVIISFTELEALAQSLHQTIDCLVVAAASKDKISGNKTEKESYTNCEIVIEAFDSTEWALWSKDPGLMQRWRERWLYGDQV